MSAKKEQHRQEFWDDWAAQADKSSQHIRFMLGIDNVDEANFLSEKDVCEVMGLLPDLTGMEVLELASGVGRFTPDLAKCAKAVVSTDFMESFVEKNRQTNSANHPNVTFKTLDATKLDYPPNSFDCVFFSWLLAYLTDDEIRKFANTMLKILRPGGFLFFRETHFTCACSCDTTGNAGDYRSIQEFCDLFKHACYFDQDSVQYRLEHLYSVNSKTYTKYRKLPTLINYLWKKSKTTEFVDIQLKIDENLYNRDCMKLYNQVIGNGFTMPGGLQSAKKWLLRLNLQSNSSILDLGCGIGGFHTLLSEEYDADVTSVDISMLACQETVLRQASLQKDKGCVEIVDLARLTSPFRSFDVILVKETLEFLDNDYDSNLFQKFKEWLQPNGQLLIGGYFQVGDSNSSTGSLNGIGKQMITKENIITDLEKCGFSQISCIDLSEDYIDYITANLKKLEEENELSDEVKKRFSQMWSSMSSSLKSREIQWVSLLAVAK